MVLDDRSVAFNNALVDAIKGGLDMAYEGREVPRFYVLETLARVPYFAYTACLHFMETIGRRDTTEMMRHHFEQSDNELHHLMIMEALGGADAFMDRFVAQHLAFFYFWFVCLLYFARPQMAYHLGQVIEEHAFATYDGFLRDNESWLRENPAPQVAKDYYEAGTWAPRMESLYDVFVAVRDDEAEHSSNLGCMSTSAVGAEMRECVIHASEDLAS